MKDKSVKYFSAISLNERIEYLRLLFRWQGSVWKLLWADFLWYISLYIGVTLLYRLYLINDPESKRIFEAAVAYMNKAAELIPLSFLLGFFVSTVLGRWWNIINSIPWMTKPAFTCQALIIGDQGDTLRNIRMTVTRYMNLAWILSIINISKKVKNRFALCHSVCNKMSLVGHKHKSKNETDLTIRQKLEKMNCDPMIQKSFGKIISDEEIVVFENFEKNSIKPSYLIPLMWATKLLERSLKAGYLKSDSTYANLLNMIQTFESSLGSLAIYNVFNIPLVYTQVIVIVVYTFLISEIFSQQIITSTGKNALEVYLPIFTIFKFLIYMGWFKVGLCYINPFGDEPSDLPLDHILDFNLEVSSSIVTSTDDYFPDYLSGTFNEEKEDRFGVLNNFCDFIKKDKMQCEDQEKGSVRLPNLTDPSCDVLLKSYKPD